MEEEEWETSKRHYYDYRDNYQYKYLVFLKSAVVLLLIKAGPS